MQNSAVRKTKAPAEDQVERKKNAVMFPTLQLESKLYTMFLEDRTLMQFQENSMMRRLMGWMKSAWLMHECFPKKEKGNLENDDTGSVIIFVCGLYA